VSSLTLVRHGQGSYLEADYDRLSELGEKQARELGNYWVKHGVKFDQAFSGPGKRHRRTAELVGETFERSSLSWPEVVQLNDLDEFQAENVMRQLLPVMRERHDNIRLLEQAFLQAGDLNQVRKGFQRLFQAVTTLWVQGDSPLDDTESWQAFCDRVHRAVMRLRSTADAGKRIVAFTSAGPIAATVQMALQLSPQKTLELSWMMRNSAFTDFLFSGDRFSLSAFNAFPHLNEPSLLTYR
jgi:broad specificity phosphatase PhoE